MQAIREDSEQKQQEIIHAFIAQATFDFYLIHMHHGLQEKASCKKAIQEMRQRPVDHLRKERKGLEAVGQNTIIDGEDWSQIIK